MDRVEYERLKREIIKESEDALKLLDSKFIAVNAIAKVGDTIESDSYTMIITRIAVDTTFNTEPKIRYHGLMTMSRRRGGISEQGWMNQSAVVAVNGKPVTQSGG